MSDPNFYRFYESNLEAYKIKADKEFRCSGEAIITSLTLSGISHYTGTSALNTTHTISIPLMANLSCNGEITCYLKNDAYTNISMIVVLKAGGSVKNLLLYQNVGNYTSVSVTSSGNNVILTCSPAGSLTWLFRGI